MKKQTQTNTTPIDGYLAVMRGALNLIEKYQDSDIQDKFNHFKSKIDGFSDSNEAFNLKTGDVIKFIGGYDSDIEFTSQILGFNSKGFAFVLWDCYWVGLDLNERLIAKL